MAKKSAPKKKEAAKPKLKKIEFNEDVAVGKTVTINSKHYIVLQGKKLKLKTTGEVFAF